MGNIAKKWTEVMRSGAVGARFMGVDLNTVMFNMESGKQLEEVCHFFCICYISIISCLLSLNINIVDDRGEKKLLSANDYLSYQL